MRKAREPITNIVFILGKGEIGHLRAWPVATITIATVTTPRVRPFYGNRMREELLTQKL